VANEYPVFISAAAPAGVLNQFALNLLVVFPTTGFGGFPWRVPARQVSRIESQ
jgi:hypothetical protein